MDETLIALAKGKLNITWDDEGTNARLYSILYDAIPTVANMVGMAYDYATQTTLDGSGETFDFTTPSMERVILLNYVAYEWNHRADSFRANYWQEIAACRQRHHLLSEEDTDAADSE